MIIETLSIADLKPYPRNARTHSKRQVAQIATSIEQFGFCNPVLIARKLGKPQSFIAKYENGERRLDVVEFINIARAIGTDPVKMLRELSKRLA